MGGTFTLGRVAGIEISISWTWIFIFALIVASLAGGVFPSTNEGLATGTYIAMGFVAAALFFASLLLHELGHAVVARREGMEISGITLWLLGGVSRFKGMFPSPGAEFRTAIAGPLVTLVIGVVFVLAGAAISLPSAVDGVVAWLGFTNLLLLGFNLLPAFPLDGGRVLHSALWKRRGNLASATSAAGAFGRGIGVLMIAAGILAFLATASFAGLWLAFIGWFLIVTAAAETRLAAVSETLAGLGVGDAMARDPVTAPPGLTLQEFLDRVYSGHHHTIYPVTDNGAVLGLLEARDVVAVPEAQRQTVRVNDRMRPLEQAGFVREQDDLAEALTTLLQTDLQRALVLRDSRLAGVLSVSDVERLVGLRQRGAR